MHTIFTLGPSYSYLLLVTSDEGSIIEGWSSSGACRFRRISIFKERYLEVLKGFLVELHGFVGDSQLSQSDAFGFGLSFLPRPLEGSLQKT